MALDPPGLLMDMNHLDMATNPNPHHRHRHPHPQHHHQSGHGHPYGAANLMMMMMPAGGEASSPFPMDAMIDPSLPDPQQLGHSLSMNHPPPVVAGDGSHLLSMAFSRLQESLRLNGGGEHMISSQEAEHKSNQCGQQLSLMTTMNPNPNFNPNPSPNPNFNPNPNPNPNLNLNPNPNPNPNLNPSPNINNACLNMIPTPPFEHDSRSPVNVFSHHHHHQNNAASMKSESAGNHSSVFTAASVNGSAAGRLGSMEDQLPASFSHGSHRSSADSNGPLSPAMNLPASNNAAHFDLEARLKLQQQRQLALHLGAGDAYHHHNHHHSHSHHHQSFNIMQDDHHINQSIDAANAINVITANNNHHNHNNSSSSNLSVFDDPSDRSETLNMLRRHIQHANNCSQDEGSNNVDSSNKLVLASHGDGDGYGGDHAHDAGMNSASANHELTTTNHHHYVGADHHQQQLISFWNHSNGGSINPTIWNK